MENLAILIIFSLIGGLFSLIGGIMLLRSNRTTEYLSKYATPFAAGALLAAVFLDLLPDGIEEANADTVLISALSGIVLFFIAERFLRWFHHHHEEELEDGQRKDPSVNLIIAGDTIHNALDGVAIAAAFLVSVPTGIVTTLAVAAHEIPQEVADFGLLLAKGLKRKKVLVVNALSSLATVVAAVITYSLGSADKLPVGVLLGLSAGFLLYIALSDIIPTIHQNADASKLVQLQTFLLLVGIVLVGLAVNAAHSYIDVDHQESQNSSEHLKQPNEHVDEHGHDH